VVRIDIWLWQTGRGNAATWWPITVLFSNGSVLEPLESKMVIGHRVAALPHPVCQSQYRLAMFKPDEAACLLANRLNVISSYL